MNEDTKIILSWDTDSNAAQFRAGLDFHPDSQEWFRWLNEPCTQKFTFEVYNQFEFFSFHAEKDSDENWWLSWKGSRGEYCIKLGYGRALTLKELVVGTQKLLTNE
ncbi:MAG: hypothetical protein ACOYYS_21760 [Chloroflexota bacterium]